MVKSWLLETPYGNVVCKKSHSFGEKNWKPVAPSKVYKSYMFAPNGDEPLISDTYVHANGKWIPARGNDVYHKKIYYSDWVKLGKPKILEGKKLGVVVKRLDVREPSMVWNAKQEKKLSDYELKRFATDDMKYIIPLPEGIEVYKNVVSMLNKKGVILITKPVTISKNSSLLYTFAIIPVGKYLMYVAIVDKDLIKPFPVDALIPGEDTTEVGTFEDEGGDLI